MMSSQRPRSRLSRSFGISWVTVDTSAGIANGLRQIHGRSLHGLLWACPYRKSNPHVLMVQPTKDRPHFDASSALNEPSNWRILA